MANDVNKVGKHGEPEPVGNDKQKQVAEQISKMYQEEKKAAVRHKVAKDVNAEVDTVEESVNIEHPVIEAEGVVTNP